MKLIRHLQSSLTVVDQLIQCQRELSVSGRFLSINTPNMNASNARKLILLSK